MRSQLHQLELVYFPISNQEAEYVKDNPEVQELISQSNLYFIGQKPETYFEFASAEEIESAFHNERKLTFNVICGNKKSQCVLDMNMLCDYYKVPVDEIDIEIGRKVITIIRMDRDKPEVFEWFFTEKLIFERSREKKTFILELDDFLDFFTYNLHYVGISKNQTSFERLIVKPHDTRLRILTNEHPLNFGSRVTDEIILFFFRVKSQEIKQYLSEEDWNELGENELEDPKRIIADAEKAFVSVINTSYNRVKFNGYPVSMDGLSGSKVNRLSYAIDENITFITDSVSLVNKRNSLFQMEAYSDFISIDFDDNTVKLHKAE
ncbi:hypothetical protein EG352_07530 [Chryseobacterium indologenes]|uniref:DUF4868 domain-containing protein n=1 Tax=Chryseobacterium indologenes TaxID=253 RepID=A0AAD0YV57_CHRID|nr:hypothetical protein [Chryseobacterium indologenes]AZB17628.1 hypothetical protein EG352_07530 [Chryseobacterium indologenes]